MDILTTPAEMRAWRSTAATPLGLVPTMGYLHQGHLELVRRAGRENATAVVSIFVNPTQFAPGEDLERYPRDEQRDLSLLCAESVDAVYLPAASAMYPAGYQTYVEVEDIARGLEGAARPGHFRGVATVVLKLINAVEPQRAYFGRKDAQQVRVIQRMARDLDLGLEVVPCEIVREPDGLAMSSRNVYLSAPERAAAPALYQALVAARSAFEAGERDADRLRAVVRERLDREPLAAIEYVSLADSESLEEREGRGAGPSLLSLAVRFGTTRLIDNVDLP